jgi:hypothetical protein
VSSFDSSSRKVHRSCIRLLSETRRSFVFKDEETSKLAYQEFEHGRARSMLLPFAQWDLYIAVSFAPSFNFLRLSGNLVPIRTHQVRPVARVAFSTCEPMEELVEDETRRIYVEDEFKPEHVHCASPTSPQFLPQSPPSGRASRRPRHDRSTSNTSLTGSAGDYNDSKSSGSYFDSSVGSVQSHSKNTSHSTGYLQRPARVPSRRFAHKIPRKQVPLLDLP